MPAERPRFFQTTQKNNPDASEQGDQHLFQDLQKKRGRPRVFSDEDRNARQRDYFKRYYHEHKDTLLEKDKRYRQEHKDAILEKAKRYQQEHKDEIKVRKKLYRQENAEKHKLYLREWRRKRKENEGITSDTHPSTAVQIFPNPHGDKQ